MELDRCEAAIKPSCRQRLIRLSQPGAWLFWANLLCSVPMVWGLGAAVRAGSDVSVEEADAGLPFLVSRERE